MVLPTDSVPEQGGFPSHCHYKGISTGQTDNSKGDAEMQKDFNDFYSDPD